MSGPFWNMLKPYTIALSVLLFGLVSYNLVCCFYVGKRFLEDPRISAETWVRGNIPQNSSIESDIYSPGWNEIRGVQLRETTMPFVSGRERLFERLFKGNSYVVGSDTYKRRVDEMVRWYSLEELTKRNPDFLAIDSLYYRRFIEQGIRRELYPSMAEFYQTLIEQRSPYEVVFDRESEAVPAWIYPHDIDFLHNRITILARKRPKTDTQFDEKSPEGDNHAG
jgi:hypothetical protein